MTEKSATDWQVLSPYLDRLLDLQEPERAAMLADLARTDARLAGDLRELLQWQQRADSVAFLQGRATQMPLSVEPGTRIGQYQLDRIIGQGGMGTVWLAHRIDGQFEAQVAIKLLNPALVGLPSEQRFLREGQLLASLKHPHIAHLIDSGNLQNGQPYLVLDYIEGTRIDEYCERHGLSVTARLRLFLQVLAAVAHAHRHLIVHRDLKPSNILVDDARTVKLLDFGIAGLLRDDLNAAPGGELTREMGTAMTPEFASPEQHRGGPVTTASDIYALGLNLFLLLAGRHPFGSGQITGAQDAPSLSSVTGNSRRARELRGDLDRIVAKALKREPTERYSTVDAFADDLRNFLDGKPIVAASASLRYRTGKFLRRHWAGVAAATIAVLSLAGAAAFGYVKTREAQAQRELALHAARRSAATLDALQLVLSEFRERDRPLTAAQLLDRSVALLTAQYRSQPDFLAEMLLSLASEYRTLLRQDTAYDLADRAHGLAQRSTRWDLAAAATCMRVRIDVRNNQSARAGQQIEQARVELARAPDDAPSGAAAECAMAEAQFLNSSRQPEAAIRVLQNARRAVEANKELDSGAHASILSNLGSVLMSNGRVVEALESYDAAAEVHRRGGRGNTRAFLMALQNVQVARYRLGEVRAADALMQQIAGRRAELMDPGDVSVSIVVNQAHNANRMHRVSGDTRDLVAARARAKADGDDYYYQYATAELSRAWFLRQRPRADVESVLLEMEADARERGLELIDATLLNVALQRIDLDLRDARHQDADVRVRALLRRFGAQTRATPRQKYLVELIAARAALAAGAAETAQVHAATAVPIAVAMAGNPDSSADVGEALLQSGLAQLAAGKRVDARATLTRARRSLENGYGADHPATQAATGALVQASE